MELSLKYDVARDGVSSRIDVDSTWTSMLLSSSLVFFLEELVELLAIDELFLFIPQLLTLYRNKLIR